MNHLKRSYVLYRKNIQPPFRISIVNISYQISPNSPLLIVNRNVHLKFLDKRIPAIYKLFCTYDNENKRLGNDGKVMNKVKTYLKTNKDKFNDTEQKVREKAQIIVEDIRETKKKVKESVENIIEVIFYYYSVLIN